MNEMKNDTNHRWSVVKHLREQPYRDYHYVAIDYLNKMPKAGNSIDDHLLLEEMIVTNSW